MCAESGPTHRLSRHLLKVGINEQDRRSRGLLWEPGEPFRLGDDGTCVQSEQLHSCTEGEQSLASVHRVHCETPEELRDDRSCGRGVTQHTGRGNLKWVAGVGLDGPVGLGSLWH